MKNRTSELIGMMTSHGLRITEQRRTMAQIFAEARGFLSAKEVYLSMVSTYRGLSFDTVYRNTKLLAELGVLEMFQIEKGYKFRMGCLDYCNHHHHMICLTCNSIYPLDYCPMQSLKIPDAFQVVKHCFEIYGYCLKCQR